jgi:tRNA (guanine37-N1)-methyltransferase
MRAKKKSLVMSPPRFVLLFLFATCERIWGFYNFLSWILQPLDENSVNNHSPVQIDILTLFPSICEGALSESMMKRARERHLALIRTHNLRDWARDKHHVTDEPPYGGGQGMVLKAEPIFEAAEAIQSRVPLLKSKVVLMSPAGRRLNQAIAAEYSREEHIIIVCGHYEGVDQRVIDHLVDDEISIGDYVLTNGAIAATVFIDAVVRLLPGVLGDEGSAADDSFARGSLEFPHYTRPVEYRGWRVPAILLSGNHGAIAKWRAEQSLEKTKRNRPDLLGGDK